MEDDTAEGAGPRPAGVGAVLAAGAGQRFRGPTPKVLAPLPDGSTLVGRAVAVATAAGLEAVAVVVGPVPAEALGPLPTGVVAVANQRWAEGQATSLALAVDWARSRGAAALTVALADQPGITAAAWRAVAGTPSPLAVATYAGRRGHPVRLGAEVWADLPSAGDEGARRLLRARPDLVVEVPCPGDPTDVDTVEDLASWARDHPADG
ncbi:nucleotidyltransferase family protein [Iamia majanohamensis]|uniref:Nucleotidyltransferase family protein n=1 Tax=Iamia majanohamensis TaxID=467976 RepID=A0AAE9YAZ9_9ACTN|nr:nucleotidyltransferase family protein [Iamia majanohamensis]WCO69121.1 nucleotidyltransferase family protein [Iamia majanohamensis]